MKNSIIWWNNLESDIKNEIIDSFYLSHIGLENKDYVKTLKIEKDLEYEKMKSDF